MHTCSMAIGDRDPLREKRLSMNERLDSWGESQKAARKNLPKMRARTHRSYRHQVKTELLRGDNAEPAAIRRKLFRKWVGPTRETHVEQAQERRANIELEPRKSEDARARRAGRRSRRSPEESEAL